MRFISKIRAQVTEEVDWEGVYRRQYPRVYNFFRFRVGDENQAEDLTAEVFTRAWKGSHRYGDNLGAFESWLFGIARNVVASYFRQKNKMPQELDIVDHENRLCHRNERMTEESIQQRQDVEKLANQLAQLGDRERELLALKYGAGFNNRQIAKLTNLSESNVGSILHRTIKKLRKEWED